MKSWFSMLTALGQTSNSTSTWQWVQKVEKVKLPRKSKWETWKMMENVWTCEVWLQKPAVPCCSYLLKTSWGEPFPTEVSELLRRPHWNSSPAIKLQMFEEYEAHPPAYNKIIQEIPSSDQEHPGIPGKVAFRNALPSAPGWVRKRQVYFVGHS